MNKIIQKELNGKLYYCLESKVESAESTKEYTLGRVGERVKLPCILGQKMLDECVEQSKSEEEINLAHALFNYASKQVNCNDACTMESGCPLFLKVLRLSEEVGSQEFQVACQLAAIDWLCGN